MKIIYFIRHAKAKKKAPTDFLRKLSERGLSDAKNTGIRLKEANIIPDIIFTSSGVRALSTANIIAKELSFNGKIKSTDELYEFSKPNLLKFVKNLSNKHNTVFIVGHNSALNEICEFLSDSVIEHFPTCAICGIKFDIDSFENICNGSIIYFDYPKKHIKDKI
ncbi:phosphohistidine phosphatase [Campylobacter blaseri]|uniref:Phosphohistidine phosphatase n=1 Tax=Campylobacter blaseri TaxID=2042961 RepID=A0A2P8QYU7_9BACT|nr:histidine phosphatase family protein [Campylobacter blaseri]PSM51412.1 phosphohistidine phosphatase [Campylobacter blaseri]PSM52862.1 phosphohistidine phosphatase [Campylobacter blaseri]QKF86166.1 phosphohistidine phosphatase [Campylobacter blaseri]